MKRRQWFAGLILGAAFLTGSSTAFAAGKAEIHAGVYADGIDLSGMTREEALTALDTYVQEMQD